MRCPACRQPVREGVESCPACGLTLAALDSHLGLPPQLTAPVADPQGLLSAGQTRSMTAAVRSLEQGFPDIHAIVVAASAPEGLTPELYAFWLFNRTGLFSPVEKSGDNHGLLLFLDASSDRAVAVLGYGLEPLFPESAITTALELATEALTRRSPADACLNFFNELQQQFHHAASQWPAVFGEVTSAPWFESATGALELPQSALADELF
jgi:hypothetical protein